MHTDKIKSALGIRGVISHEYSWRSRRSEPGAQIDLLIDRKDDVINVCEVKYTDGEFAIEADYEKALSKKLRVFREETGTTKALFLTMVTMDGLKKNQYSGIVVNELTGEDLFL